MMGKNHATYAAAAWCAAWPAWDYVPSLNVDTSDLSLFVVSTAVAAGAGVIPDLDHPDARVSRHFGVLSKWVAKGLNEASGGHRHGTHSFVFAALLTVGVLLLSVWPTVFAAVLCGVGSLASAVLRHIHYGTSRSKMVTRIALGFLFAAGVFWISNLVLSYFTLGVCCFLALWCWGDIGMAARNPAREKRISTFTKVMVPVAASALVGALLVWPSEVSVGSAAIACGFCCSVGVTLVGPSLGFRIPFIVGLACAVVPAWYVWEHHEALVPLLPVLAGGGVLIHVACDSVTKGGVPIFWPFNKGWYALNWFAVGGKGESIASVIGVLGLGVAVFQAIRLTGLLGVETIWF